MNRDYENPVQPSNAAKANVARIYDYALGGKDNFEVDRVAADALLDVVPGLRATARENRQFLQRAVRFAASQGVAQFIDIGSGLPTVQNTHEVAQGVNPDAKVAYIDYDEVVLAHARALLAENENVIAEAGDLRKLAQIVTRLSELGFIDFGKPVAVLLVAITHFLGEDCYDIVGQVKERLPSGSYLILSHATADNASPEEAGQIHATYRASTASATLRTHDEVTKFFDGLELVEPGVTGVGDWGDNVHDASSTLCYGGVGRKP